MCYSAIDSVWGFLIDIFSGVGLTLTSLLLAIIIGSTVLRLLVRPVSGSSDKAKKKED